MQGNFKIVPTPGELRANIDALLDGASYRELCAIEGYVRSLRKYMEELRRRAESKEAAA